MSGGLWWLCCSPISVCQALQSLVIIQRSCCGGKTIISMKFYIQSICNSSCHKGMLKMEDQVLLGQPLLYLYFVLGTGSKDFKRFQLQE